MRNRLLIAGIALYFVAAAFALAGRYGAGMGPHAGEAIRWLAAISLIGYAFMRRSLTAWILIGMVLGAEIGYDFPHFAVNLRILSQIFLQLIRVIIAPLPFFNIGKWNCGARRPEKGWTHGNQVSDLF